MYHEVGQEMQYLFDTELEQALLSWVEQVKTLATWVEEGKADLREVIGEMIGAMDLLTEEPEKI